MNMNSPLFQRDDRSKQSIGKKNNKKTKNNKTKFYTLMVKELSLFNIW